MKKIALLILLLICCSSVAFSQKVDCYNHNRSKGISLYDQGKCAEAKKWFNAAKNCPDKPKQNDIQSWIKRCEKCIGSKKHT